MSTPKILIGELEMLVKHHLETAARKAKLLTALRDQVNGTWVSVRGVKLEIGRLYFTRVKWGTGGHSAPWICRWENHGWVREYGESYGAGTQHNQLEIWVSTQELAAMKRGRA